MRRDRSSGPKLKYDFASGKLTSQSQQVIKTYVMPIDTIESFIQD